MLEPVADGASPIWKPLNSRQRRVLGVLVEKAKTTPDVYPMTVNGIVSGCNQKSNREPVITMTAEEVEEVLGQLRALGAVTEVQGSGRVAKYRHHFYDWLGIDKAESAVMCELLLRGAQTLGELRGRAARMEPIPDLAALKKIVDLLLSKNLMLELTPAGRGQVVTHNLYKDRELVELKAEFAGRPVPSGGDDDEEDRPASATSTSAHASHAAATPHHVQHMHTPAPTGGFATRDMFNELQVDLAEMRAELARLQDQVRQLEDRLG